jgi:hypothetical protein
MKQNKINLYSVPLFQYFKNEINKIEGKWWYNIKFISSYSILLGYILLLFFKSKQ